MSPGHGSKINRKQEQAIAALLSERTVTTAAASIGIGEKTLRRWLQDPGFQEAFTEAKRDCLNQARERLKQITVSAVDVLADALKDMSPAIRLRAAVAILDYSSNSDSDLELESRIARLETLVR